MVSKTAAIAAFLETHAPPDLARLYNHDMECQVTVAQDEGEPISGEFKGVKWRGYEDQVGNLWKPFRIPRNAKSDPVYEDHPLTFDLAAHAEGIGMTGWDWKNRCSKWVAYDFDAIIGHSDTHTAKLDPSELSRVKQEAYDIPWVTVRKSTGGRGLHLYVFLDDVPTDNHTEHAALSRAILAQMSALSGYDFNSKVDICGGNMWVWHRKQRGTDGLSIIKSGGVLDEVPHNWRDHMDVIRGSRRKVKHNFYTETVEERFDQLSGQKNRVKLETAHRDLIKWLAAEERFHWWDPDNHMLVTHTVHLREAYEELNYIGIFETISEGKDLDTQNCFCFPQRRGSWIVRRFSPGTSEHPSWEQDGQGWTRCYLNVDPDLKTASLAYGGLEDPKGGYIFSSLSEAKEAALKIGAHIDLPPGIHGRACTFKAHKDGRLVVEVPYESHDDVSKMQGWLHKPSSKTWTKIFTVQAKNSSEIDMEDYDDVIRHVVAPDGANAGWVVFADDQWIAEPLEHAKSALRTFGLSASDVTMIVGTSIFKPWQLVVKPFEPEYPGGRQWNRKAPQLSFVPTVSDSFSYPTWSKVLNHIGSHLDFAVQNDPWCIQYGLNSGADWLKCWIAAMFQYPSQPLPYLFLYSDKQNTGKSTLHEALSLLFHPGYCRADTALTSSSNFNGELEGAVLCVVEETNLKEKPTAYERIKDWVTARELPIHRKMMTPYSVVNTTHWIQCANTIDACGRVPFNDTRITYINVPQQPEEVVPKTLFIGQLEKEAPDFLGEMMSLDIPPTNDRLRIPCLATADKEDVGRANMSPVLQYIESMCYYVPGKAIRLSDLYDHFRNNYIDPSERAAWTKPKFSREVPSDKHPKGRLRRDPNWYFGNISLSPPVEGDPEELPYFKLGDTLVQDV